MISELTLIDFPMSDIERDVLKSVEAKMLPVMADALDHDRIMGEGPVVARITAVRTVAGKKRLVTIRIEAKTMTEDA